MQSSEQNAIVYRNYIGRPLTSDEVDSNFRILETRLALLEEKLSLPLEGINNITLERNQLIFKGRSGEILNSISFEKMYWRPKGTWKKSEPYAFQDIVQCDDTLLLCRQPHVSDELIDMTYWQEIFNFNYKPYKGIDHEMQTQFHLPIYTINTLPSKENPRLGEMVFILDSGPACWDGDEWKKIGYNDSFVSE